MIHWTPDDLARLRNSVSPEIGGAARLAAERALPFFTTFRLGWAAYGEPTVEMLECSYLEAISGFKEDQTSWSSGYLLVRKTYYGEIDEFEIDFGLSLTDVVQKPDGEVVYVTPRMPNEGGIGYTSVAEAPDA